MSDLTDYEKFRNKSIGNRIMLAWYGFLLRIVETWYSIEDVWVGFSAKRGSDK